MKTIIKLGVASLLATSSLRGAEPQLPQEGFEHAFKLFTMNWQLCADSAIAHKHYPAGSATEGRGPENENMDEVVQKKGVHWITNATEISYADSLNGVEWTGSLICAALAERWYVCRHGDTTLAEEIDKLAWGEWRSPEEDGVLEGYVLSKKGGRWSLRAMPLRRRVSDGFEPIACDVLQPGGMKAKLQRATQDAHTRQCLSNLKQIGLAARMWAGDHGDKFPRDLAELKQELASSTKVLMCPADVDRRNKPPKDWADVTKNTVSYEIVAGADPAKPETVFGRCLVHKYVVYSDGSASKTEKK